MGIEVDLFRLYDSAEGVRMVVIISRKIRVEKYIFVFGGLF